MTAKIGKNLRSSCMTFMIEVTPSFAVLAVIIGPGPKRVDFSILVSVNSSCMPKNIRFLEQHHRTNGIFTNADHWCCYDVTKTSLKKWSRAASNFVPARFIPKILARKSLSCVHTFPPAPTKLDIRHFHVVVVQWRQRNAKKPLCACRVVVLSI